MNSSIDEDFVDQIIEDFQKNKYFMIKAIVDTNVEIVNKMNYDIKLVYSSSSFTMKFFIRDFQYSNSLIEISLVVFANETYRKMTKLQKKLKKYKK